MRAVSLCVAPPAPMHFLGRLLLWQIQHCRTGHAQAQVTIPSCRHMDRGARIHAECSCGKCITLCKVMRECLKHISLVQALGQGGKETDQILQELLRV